MSLQAGTRQLLALLSAADPRYDGHPKPGDGFAWRHLCSVVCAFVHRDNGPILSFFPF